MTDIERTQFEEEMTESEELREELTRSRALLDSLQAANDAPIVRMVNAQIVQAIEKGASDLHIVPQRRNVMVRVRVDGVLQEVMTLPKDVHTRIVDRWKELADMNVGERRLPQDGRFPVKQDQKEYNLRVSILPTVYGERVTARILAQSGILLGLDRLNLRDGPLAALKRLARLNAGLILTSGYTGAGKTTLLYSLLQEIHQSGRAGRNLMTIEDPVEYGFNLGISQTGVNVRAGLTFAAALRATLRSDPDAILCAQMRDLETAEIAIETALTGHLLLSALHTTSALGTVQRLRDMGVENFLIADTLAGAIGQRLVRRIDSRKVEEYEPAAEDLQRLGLSRADGPFVRGAPTDENHGSGFRGRIPLIEVIEVTPALRRKIAERASYEELWRIAFPQGTGSLFEDARARVKAGLTTVEEANWALFNYPVPQG